MATRAILYDVETVLSEDPQPEKGIGGTGPFIRIVLDPHLRIPLRSHLVKTACTYRTIVVAEYTAHNTPKLQSLEQARVEVWFCDTTEQFRERAKREGIIF